MVIKNSYVDCAELIKNSEAILIATGAGMGVDSGLPDFRGTGGWYSDKTIQNFGQDCFELDPRETWKHYNKFLNCFQKSTPHNGFFILKKWLEHYQRDYFVVTSNIDRFFQRTGFPEEKIYEKHGSIYHLQCIKPCSKDIWENPYVEDLNQFQMPRCINCSELARPNILMFGDVAWVNASNTEEQFFSFLERHYKSRLVVLEIGAGLVVSSIRKITHAAGAGPNATIIPINPNDFNIYKPHYSLKAGALEALVALDKILFPSQLYS